MAIVTLDQYNQQQGIGVDYGAINQQQQEQNSYSGYGIYNDDEGSILDTIGKKWDTAFEAVMSSNAGKEHSEFAAANLKRKAEEAKAARDKLGMTGQVIAGGADIIPIAAASMVNPYLGAGVATGMYTGNIAAEQAMEGQEVNWKTAGLGGLATGAADLATGGLAGRLRAGLPAAAPLAKRVGINVAEDATSSIAGNAFTNMALGKDWDEGMVEAGLMGAGAGGVVRGGAYGFSKARNTAVNKFGEKALNDVSEVSSKAKLTPTENFANEAYAYHNETAKMYNDAMNTADPEVRSQNVEASVNLAGKHGGRAADLDAMKLADQYGIPFLDTAFDIEVPAGLSRQGGTYKLYEEMGISPKEIQKAGEAPAMAQAGRFGRTKATREGLTKESYEADFQTKFKDAMGQIKGTFNTNVTSLKNIAKLAREGGDADPQFAARVESLAADASHLQKLMGEYTGTEKLDVGQDIQIVSKRLLNGLMENGLMNKMVGLDGKAGSFDPVKGILTIDRLERMSKANMPNVHQGAPNRFRNTLLGTGIEGTVADAALVAAGAAPAAVLRRGIATIADETSRQMSQSRLKRLKQKTSGRLEAAERAVEARKRQAMTEGDMELVAKASEEQLKMNEIETGDPIPSPFEADAQAVAAARSGPVPARDPRQTMAMLDPEEQAAVAEVAKTDPVGAEELAEQLAAQKSAPVPAAQPTRRVPTPEPEPTPNPAMMSRSMAAQPELSPEARRAQMAAQLQEAVLAEAAARNAEAPVADTVPEVAPEAPVRSAPVSARTPKQPQAPEPEIAPTASEAAPARADSKELVRAPLQRDKDQYADMSANDKADMLNTDPARLKELRNAGEELKQTNTLLEKMSSKHKMSPEVAAVYLDSMGGVRGVKQSIKDENLDMSVHDYVDRQIKRMELEKTRSAKEKLAEIRNQPKPKPVKVEPTPEETARVVADKHIGIREELSSLGYGKEIVDEALKKSKATDTTVDFDPKIVKNWARTLSKQELDDAREAVAEATSKAKELVTRASELSKKVMDEGERSRIENDLKDQIEAHRGLMNKKGITGQERARAREQAQRLERELEKVSKEQNKLRKDAEEAATAARQATERQEEARRAFDKIQTQNQKRMEKLKETAKDVERLNTQKDEIRERMMAEGATREEADQFLTDMFPYQDKSLNNSQFTRARDKAVKQVQAQKQAEIDAQKQQAEAVIKAMDEAELEAAAKELVELDNKVKDYSDPEVLSMQQLVADELEARGQKGEAAYMRAFSMILDKAERRKKAYPNNKDYWISSDDKQTLQTLMNTKAGSSWMGNLQVQLASHFFGDEHLRRKYIHLSEAEIQSRIDAGIIDSDIVAKPKKSWKAVAKKVNKKQ